MRRLAHRYPSLSWVCFLLALLSLGNALKVSLFENIADDCSSSATCAQCTTRGGCGWCQDRQTCLAGNVNSSADGSCSTTKGSWHFSAKDCCENNHTSCSDCTSLPHCGWCNAAPGENATCFEKAANGLPFNGTCIHKHWELHNDECESNDNDDKKEVAIIVGVSIALGLSLIAAVATIVFLVIKRLHAKKMAYAPINDEED